MSSLKPLVRLALSELGFSSNFIRKWFGHVLVEGCSYAEGAAACHKKTPVLPGAWIKRCCRCASHDQSPAGILIGAFKAIGH